PAARAAGAERERLRQSAGGLARSLDDLDRVLERLPCGTAAAAAVPHGLTGRRDGMSDYLIKRLIGALPVLFGVSVVIFLLMHMIPGVITAALLGPMATEAARADLRHALGLDQPLLVQYVKWLSLVLSGDFGKSIATSLPVSHLVLPKFGNTVILAAASLLLSLAVGFGIVAFAAARTGASFDRPAMSITLCFARLPPYSPTPLLSIIFPP